VERQPREESSVTALLDTEEVATRLRITLRGAVQGVGFRPFVYRLATELRLCGWVLNSSSGLVVEVEGPSEQVDQFALRLERERPKPAVVQAKESARLPPAGFTEFEIRASDHESEKTAGLVPDLALCDACRAELFDPTNRRYLYPFINCTNCGPRYSIIRDIPYDRCHTTMHEFTFCSDCRREYESPADRRFDAQPNACPVCGPHLAGVAVAEAATALAAGRIVALKGIGGFQLLVDARCESAVARLRERKCREEKPFALMMPTIAMVREFCEVSEAEQKLLESQAAPIVLLKPKLHEGIARNVAHNSPYLGVMLPYSPLHHLLAREFPFPIVATSGNRSDEPIAIANEEARAQLGGIADVFILHNRPIARPLDDSVVRVARGRESVIRRARGYAPLPVRVSQELSPVLAVGGHLKNTVAIAVGRQVVMSQHIGDLETPEARGAFERAIEDLCRLYNFRPEKIACDLHPDYSSTQWAFASGLPVEAVQHHHAHAASCAAENGVHGPYLAVCWDGTGYGLDGTVWGGEFFLGEGRCHERFAHLRPFLLPGGEAAIREGWRAAAALVAEVFGPGEVDPIIARMLERRINTPVTTSVGRLFDAIAALTGVARVNRFEGQAAMLLERTIGSLATDESYSIPDGDWEPLVRRVTAEIRAGVDPSLISARFHNGLAEWILEVAVRGGLKQVVMSGGVFQNRYLVERTAALLEARGFSVYTHRQVPAGDGGIALGQAVLAGGV
jgi:hydrogenase maturation protein HypF